ncbi:hypothetical protein GJ496_008823 [Pomphorhynchus laevis]|nr:hypothetical protein GJ496_008408 [Pomphorhynchus laevis]KAI0983971.1 hypothetical protein GJ496_008823 [Pomphorhynchus laevis]
MSKIATGCFKRFVHRRRPMWLGPSPSKYWYVPKEKPIQDPKEYELLCKWWEEYTWKYQSVMNLFEREYNIIKEAENKNIEVIDKIKESVIAENESENSKLTKLRIDDARKLHEETVEYSRLRDKGHLNDQALCSDLIESEVQWMKEESKHFVNVDKLEEEIEAMLADRLHYDFVLNERGVIQIKS